MAAKDRLGFGRTGRLPAFVHSPGIPIAGDFVHGLRRRHVAPLMPGITQPRVQFGFRPEAPDVGSGEPDVIPEGAGRDEQVDQALGADHPSLHCPQHAFGTMSLAVTE